MKARTGIIAGLSALTVAAGAGVAGAAVIVQNSPVSSTGVISGCFTTKAFRGSHQLALQDTGTKCPRGTTPVTWNQKTAVNPGGPTAATATPVDFGTVQITVVGGPSLQDGGPSAGTGTYKCTLTTFGPDARTATAVPDAGHDANLYPAGGGCLIKGLSGAVGSFQLTPIGQSQAVGIAAGGDIIVNPAGNSVELEYTPANPVSARSGTYYWTAFLKSATTAPAAAAPASAGKHF